MPGFPTAPAVQTITDKLATIAPELGNVPGYYVYLKDPISGTIYESATSTDSGGNWSIAGVTMGLTYQYSYGRHPATAYPFQGAYVASNPPSEKASLGWYNVKVDYGAKGDGVTNDSAAFQAAVTAAAANASGGYVVGPPGTYLLNSAITGMGTPATVSFMFFGATFTGAGASSVTAGLVNWVIASASLSFGTGVPGGLDTPLWAITASPAARGRMGVSYAENLYNGAVVDPTMVWGYNISGGGTLPKSGEPGLGWSVEGYYDDLSGAIKMEAYLQYIFADGVNYNRPLFFQINRTTNLVSAWVAATPLFQIVDRYGSQSTTNILDVSTNFLRLYAPTAAANIIRANAATSQTAQLQLGYNAVDAVVTLAPASASVAELGVGSAVYRFYANLNGGAAGGGFVVGGVQENSAVGLFAVGTSDIAAKGLVVRGKASQTGNLFEAQDQNSAAHVKITAGHSSLKASLVVGNAALATTATDGFLYLPTCAGTPTGVPTTQTGTAAHVFDTTGNKLWVYNAGWKGVVVA